MSVRPSVCLSVTRVDCDKTEEKSVQVLYRTKDYLAQFYEKKMVGGAPPLKPKILGQTDCVGAKSP